jgi:hypothetical protein
MVMAGMGAERLASGDDDFAPLQFLELSKQSALIIAIDH